MANGYGYGPTGYRGGLGHHAYFGGYTTAFGNGYGNGSPWLGNGYSTSYPMFGYNNGGYGYRGDSGYPAYAYGARRSTHGKTMAYGRGSYQPGYYFEDD